MPRCSCNHSLQEEFQLPSQSPTKVFARFVVVTHFEGWLQNVSAWEARVKSFQSSKEITLELVVREVSRLWLIPSAMFFRNTENQVSPSSKLISEMLST